MISANLHGQVRIAHSSIDSQFGKFLATVLFHGIQNSLCLEAGSLEGCACEMAFLRVLSYPD